MNTTEPILTALTLAREDLAVAKAAEDIAFRRLCQATSLTHEAALLSYEAAMDLTDANARAVRALVVALLRAEATPVADEGTVDCGHTFCGCDDPI